MKLGNFLSLFRVEEKIMKMIEDWEVGQVMHFSGNK